MRTFGSTEEAYNACQCDETIVDGDLLVVPREKIVGLAWTWPLAITTNYGEFHTLAVGGCADHLLKDAHIPLERVANAIAYAAGKGWPVHPEWMATVKGVSIV